MATRQPDAPTFADLYCGIGSLRFAFETHGATCLWACPSDAESARTYQENFGDDILAGERKMIPSHDVLVANLDAAPSAKPRGRRGISPLDLFLDVLVTKRPSACLLARAVKPDGCAVSTEIDAFLTELTAIGYFVHRVTLDARRFGLPHARATDFIVGIDHESTFRFPSGRRQACKFDKILERTSEHQYLSEAERDKLVARQASSATKGKDWRIGFVTDGCANTLSDAPDAPCRNILVESVGRWRFLTERELARIQGFPDSFIVNQDRRKAHRQFARAVPIPCAAAVAERIIRILRPNGFKRSADRNGNGAACGIFLRRHSGHPTVGNSRAARESDEPRSNGRIRSPARWWGSLNHCSKKIASLIGEIDHECYVEPFCGSCAVLFEKRPSNVECINDRETNLAAFWRVLQDTKLRRRLIDMVANTPYRRAAFLESADELARDDGTDLVRTAHTFVVTCNQARGGVGRNWSYGKGSTSTTSAWAKLPERLAATAQRLKAVQVECRPFEDILRRYDSPQAVFLLDPPCLPETRESATVYTHECSREDHIRLLRMANNLQGAALICGYENPLYRELLSAWHAVKLDGRSFGGPRRNGRSLPRRSLHVWMNFKPSRRALNP